MTTSGYYGSLFGISYEYRFQKYGFNASIGYGYGGTDVWGYIPFVSVNTGMKLYLSNKKKVLRNIYFNFLPICYYGQEENHIYTYYVGINQNIICIDQCFYKHLWGLGIFFGYSPVWHINKKIALGFNIDIGVKVNYFRFNKWCPINSDLGFIIKF